MSGTGMAYAVSEEATCKHCGAVYRSINGDKGFCCKGCEYVNHIIESKGYERYYSLKNKVTSPVGSSVFAAEDYDWLLATEKEAVEENGSICLKLSISGLSCMGCVWLVEEVFRKLKGARHVSVRTQYGEIDIEYAKNEFDLCAFAVELHHLGYFIGPLNTAARKEGSRLMGLFGVCSGLTMNVMLSTLPSYLGLDAASSYTPILQMLAFVLATCCFFLGGSYFIRRAWEGLKRKTLHIDAPIALGLIVSWCASVIAWLAGMENVVYFDFVAVFTTFMLGGRWLQTHMLEKHQHMMRKENIIPEEIAFGRWDDTGFQEDGTKAVENINIGDTCELGKGMLVPVVSRLLSKSASLSLQSINGEMKEAVYRSGALLPAGALNVGQSGIVVKSEEAWGQSLLKKLITKRESAGNPFFEKILRYYLAAVIVLAVAGAVYWALSGLPAVAFEVFVSLLVVSCPCAIGIALPLTDERAAVQLTSHGIFVQSESLWGRLRKISRIVFDKTGTLTLEKLRLEKPERLKELSDLQRKALASMTIRSLHPVSRALYEELLSSFPDLAFDSAVSEKYEEIPGYGIKSGVEGVDYELRRGDDGETLFIAEGKELLALRFGEQVKPEVREALRALSSEGYAIRVLSGDSQDKVNRLMDALDMDRSYGEGSMSPEQKAERIKECDAEATILLGDGLNDSLAMDAAGCSGLVVADKSALGEKADFQMLGTRVSGLNALLRTCHRRRRVVRRLFVFTVSYNAVAAVACLMAIMTPLIAAVLMPLSSVVSILIAWHGIGNKA